MAQTATHTPSGIDAGGGHGHNGNGGYSGGRAGGSLAINRGVFGMLIFIATELMFFAGLVSAYLILRSGNPIWPPPDQPRLPTAATGVNTAILLLSGFFIHRAVLLRREGKSEAVPRMLTLTLTFGSIFLLIQGYEWLRLIGYGLTASSGIYGATFYTLIGAHGLHVLAAVVFLSIVLARVRRRDFRSLEVGYPYWLFVVAIWPILYVLVYLV